MVWTKVSPRLRILVVSVVPLEPFGFQGRDHRRAPFAPNRASARIALLEEILETLPQLKPAAAGKDISSCGPTQVVFRGRGGVWNFGRIP